MLFSGLGGARCLLDIQDSGSITPASDTTILAFTDSATYAHEDRDSATYA